MDILIDWVAFWLAPILTLFVSFVYFRASPKTQSLSERLAVSAHGAAIAVLYFGAHFFWNTGASRPDYGTPFAYMLLVPVALAIFSAFRFRGKASVHLLQIINLICLLWTFAMGTMAITGNWL